MFGSGIPCLTPLIALRGLGRFFGLTFFAIATLQVFPAVGIFCRAMERRTINGRQRNSVTSVLRKSSANISEFCKSAQ